MYREIYFYATGHSDLVNVRPATYTDPQVFLLIFTYAALALIVITVAVVIFYRFGSFGTGGTVVISLDPCVLPVDKCMCVLKEIKGRQRTYI